MTLRVIGAGLGRTGTHSTQLALNQLGFPCYHMTEVLLEQGEQMHLDFWRMVANSPPETQHDWELIFAKYAASVDNPGCCVWRELYGRLSGRKGAAHPAPARRGGVVREHHGHDLLHRVPAGSSRC